MTKRFVFLSAIVAVPLLLAPIAVAQTDTTGTATSATITLTPSRDDQLKSSLTYTSSQYKIKADLGSGNAIGGPFTFPAQLTLTAVASATTAKNPDVTLYFFTPYRFATDGTTQLNTPFSVGTYSCLSSTFGVDVAGFAVDIFTSDGTDLYDSRDTCGPFKNTSMSISQLRLETIPGASISDWHVVSLTARFQVTCLSTNRSLTGTISYTEKALPGAIRVDASNVKEATANFGSCNSTNGGGGGGGGNGGGGGGGGSTIGAFPGFGGFGAGAFPGGQGGGGGTSASGTPFVFIDSALDPLDGTPSLENTDELDVPLTVVSASNTENVKLTASSDPDGLDLSLIPDTLPPNNDGAVPVLIVKPRADTLPRDYLITVVAASGGVSANTSFLVSLTCDSPFISSLSTSQPQSQTINSGQSVTLSVTGIGTGPFRYQWYEGTTGNTDFPVANATDRNFTTPALTNSHTYWVRVTNPCGTADSNPATVTVH